MNCPICRSSVLARTSLETDLPCSDCHSCGGHWVNSFEFWNWLARHPAADGDELATGVDLPPPQEIKGARLCPECGHFLTRFKVGAGFDFTIDRCGSCGGIWFDAQEWEFLKSRGLHGETHRIFSSVWQSQVRKEQSAKELEKLFQQRIGTADFEKARDVKSWLAGHPRRSEILGYLNDGQESGRESA